MGPCRTSSVVPKSIPSGMQPTMPSAPMIMYEKHNFLLSISSLSGTPANMMKITPHAEPHHTGCPPIISNGLKEPIIPIDHSQNSEYSTVMDPYMYNALFKYLIRFSSLLIPFPLFDSTSPIFHRYPCMSPVSRFYGSHISCLMLIPCMAGSYCG